ncbi:SIS domain-containing protein [Liquorilactobacillus vini]|uniref:Fructosamine deglycase n=2 Tax=Liquorilactobacillus vini TaxID=238015 RepID=A0A0R2C0F7_9LACO|nr:SIS domain-containing protein [Liquorilactobacillus vini]KRM82201.1 sugar isomerase (SIS) [Liquorilactobacillus vini DSM 20605]
MKDFEKIDSAVSQLKGIKKVYFIGCGASMSDLYPAYYLIKEKGKSITSKIYTANELIYSKPDDFGTEVLAVIASLGGNTKESVNAIKYAKENEATVIAITGTANSPLTISADFSFIHGFQESYAAKTFKMQIALYISASILNKFDDYEDFELFKNGLTKIDDLIEKSVKLNTPKAELFAKKMKDSSIIYVLSSGASLGVAYSTASFLFMEMQWLPAVTIHTGEYFHGPFELTEKKVPYLLFMNEGSTRHLDARALEFMQRFDAETFVIDAKDFGLGNVISSKVVDFFNPLILTGVMRPFEENLARERNHPLTSRRYMWKLENY